MRAERVTGIEKSDEDAEDTQDAADHSINSGGSLLYSVPIHIEIFAIASTGSVRGVLSIGASCTSP